MADELYQLNGTTAADPRERAAFAVSQHVDGTLDPLRRAEVADRLADDRDLAAMRDDFAALDRLLRREPPADVLDRLCGDVRGRVMSVVLADDEAAPLPMPTEVPATRRRWLPTAVAAAAALAVGVSIGLLNNIAGDDADVAVDPAPRLDVAGPAVVAQAPPADPAALTVAGPAVASADGDGPTLSVFGLGGDDLTAIYSPESMPTEAGGIDGTEVVRSPFPDYAAIYNASVVVERPARVVVAAVPTDAAE